MTLTITSPTTADVRDRFAESKVTVNVDRLIVGRAIRFPIYDKNSVLLLAEDSVITDEFKRQLKARDIVDVQVHPEDAPEISRRTGGSGRPSVAVNFDPVITDKLNETIAAGIPLVTNQGPAVRASRVFHGCKGYDAGRREELKRRHESATRSLTGIMSEVLRGADLDGSSLVDTTAGYVKELAADVDQLLTVPLKTTQDQMLAGHCLQMSLMAMAIGVELGLNSDNVCRIGVAGLLHDWGMFHVPRAIRESNRLLSKVEMLEIKKHPIYSVDALERLKGLPTLVPMISYQVHERLDGTGYPRGRSAKNIHLFARILHVADAFVALTSPRPHRKPVMPYAAMLSLLRQESGYSADPLVIRGLLRVVSLFPIGSYVSLNDNSVARVIRGNGDHYTEPVVQLVQDSRRRRFAAEDESAIIDLSQSNLKVRDALPALDRQELTYTPHFRRK